MFKKIWQWINGRFYDFYAGMTPEQIKQWEALLEEERAEMEDNLKDLEEQWAIENSPDKIRAWNEAMAKEHP